MSERVFVAADWRAVESRLTAHFSGDPVLTAELAAELTGGPKVHALNAALIYGIDPADAKSHMVNIQGQMRPAYDGGKKVSHLWNYGGGARTTARILWVPEKFVAAGFEKLAGKYTEVCKWRTTLANRVFGQPRFVCPRCGWITDADCDCPDCTRGVGVPIPVKFAGYDVEPTRIERTPFGRLRRYPGRRREGQNALAAQHPQSSGASMWNITLARLHGYDPVEDVRWPTPEGVLQYDPREPWTTMLRASETFVATGTYDSYYLETFASKQDEILRWLLWTMEQSWPELGGTRYPAEGLVGYNLGKFNDDLRKGVVNLRGLKERHDVTPFSLDREASWQERQPAC